MGRGRSKAGRGASGGTVATTEKPANEVDAFIREMAEALNKPYGNEERERGEIPLSTGDLQAAVEAFAMTHPEVDETDLLKAIETEAGLIEKSKPRKKYSGFSITQPDGTVNNYVVADGQVFYAETGRDSNLFAGLGGLDVIQQGYETAGSIDALVKRINAIGRAKAKKLTPTQIDKMQTKYDNEARKKREKFERDVYKRKKGVNRHSANWSAM